jgi:hypothetical protein
MPRAPGESTGARRPTISWTLSRTSSPRSFVERDGLAGPHAVDRVVERVHEHPSPEFAVGEVTSKAAVDLPPHVRIASSSTLSLDRSRSRSRRAWPNALARRTRRSRVAQPRRTQGEPTVLARRDAAGRSRSLSSSNASTAPRRLAAADHRSLIHRRRATRVATGERPPPLRAICAPRSPVSIRAAERTTSLENGSGDPVVPVAREHLAQGGRREARPGRPSGRLRP